MKRVRMLKNSIAGGHGWNKGESYEVTPERAEGFIKKGLAELEAVRVARDLASFGGGLVVGDKTDKDLVGACKREGVKIKKERE